MRTALTTRWRWRKRVSVRRRASGRVHYNYRRDYDPATGRYVESDPIGLDGGISTFAYVDDDPIGAVDRNGLGPLKLIVLCREGYKAIKVLRFKQAVQAVRRGEDVLATSTKQARRVAKAASEGKGAIRDLPHKDGYMRHYHPNPRTGGHVFYSVLSALAIRSYVECEDCVKGDIADIADVFNPLSLPKDAVDIYSDLTSD